ncbi:MAG: hypothetical protein R6V62_09845 [Candidatus Fermentibacteraceae bacterium]
MKPPFACLAAGVWVFLVWRLAGMPDPGGMGRLLPLSWVICSLLSYGCGKSVPAALSMALFTIFSLFWRVIPWGWQGAAASAVSGLLVMGFAMAGQRMGIIRAILPVAFLMIATVPFTSDEVRFAEIASDITGTDGYSFEARPGDPAPGDSHHTRVYPLILAPGTFFGPVGIRIMGLLPLIGCLLMLRVLLTRGGMPSPGMTAVMAALLMPGFTLLGPALSGWTAAAAICAFALLPGGRRGFWGTLLLSGFLIALKMRYAGAAAGMFVCWYLENNHGCRRRILIPLAVLGLVAMLLVIDRFLLNGGVLWVRYGTAETLTAIGMNLFKRPSMLLRSAFEMLLDVEAGLLPKAPWVIAAMAGMPLFRKSGGKLFGRLALPAFFYIAVHLVWSGESWHGLPSPATRIFLPLVPLLAASLAMVLERKTSRLLIGLSVGVSSLLASVPVSRFNLGSGTDNLMRLIDAASQGVSMVRHSEAVLLFWTLVAFVAFLLVRHDRDTGLKALLAGGALALAIPPHPGRMEAEEAGPLFAHGAMIYPMNPDPGERTHWFFSKQRTLVLDHPAQRLYIPCGRLTFRASGEPGAMLVIGGDTIDAQTELLPVPAAFHSLRRGTTIPDRPENRGMRLHTVTLRGPATVTIPEGGRPVYFDWFEIAPVAEAGE